MHFLDDGPKGQVKLATIRRILPFFKNHKPQVYFSVLFVILGTGLTSSLPLLFRHLIDVGIPSRAFDTILLIGLAYLGLLVLRGVLQFIQSIVLGYMGIDIVNDLKLKLFEHILGLSMKFYDKNPPGKLISRIESDSQKLFLLFSQVGLQIMWAILTLIISLVIMISSDPSLALIVLALLPLYMVGTFIVFKYMRAMFRKEREMYAKITGFVGEHIKAIPVLRNLNIIDWSKSKFFHLNKDLAHYNVKIYSINESIWYFLFLAPQMAVAMILYKSVPELLAGTRTIGTVWMFIQYIQMAIMPLIMIAEQFGEVQRAFGAADRIFDILDTKSEVSGGSEEPISFQKNIRFENVNFSYDGEKQVLKDASFEIEKGKTLAIVGPTGSGKTTIISLLTRFYDPQQGKILIDGQDIKNYCRKSLREKMSLVLQEIFLFPGSLLDNLRVLRDDIPEKTAKDAAKIIGLDEHFNTLARGYETELSEDGGNLSFGERQLLSFSRALTFDPEILIMDEATSSVDPYTESKIQMSMERLFKGRTSIIVAHRLTTVEKADKILVLVDGKVIEEGSHKVLIAKKGFYENLYSTQMGI